jgi:hypothetical protein
MTRLFDLRAALALAVVAVVAAPAGQAFAWGATGHRLIGQGGIAALPPELPAFLRTPAAIEMVGELAREPDRSKAAGKSHDTDSDPGHFLDLGDDGKVMGGPALANLPASRMDYDAALHAVGSDSYRAGYLPYSIIDGWQQLAKDFAYVRVLTAAIPREKDRAHRRYMQHDLARRQQLTLRDVGVWAHYVGDASQPLHVSVHFNGWGPYPNPGGYTEEKVHAPFEGAFVRANLDFAAVRAAMPPAAPCTDAIEVCTSRYLAKTQAEVEPFYALWKAGAFTGPDRSRGRAFATARVAAGAAELRDLIVTAWRASASGNLGYPAITVEQVVKQGIDPYDALYGQD